jgi:alkyl hydroperoxide reductase subunit AhpC
VVLPNGKVDGNFDFYRAKSNQYAILFFNPYDLTFVCSTELLRLGEYTGEFEQPGAKVFAVSVDSHFGYLAWRNQALKDVGIRSVDINHGF